MARQIFNQALFDAIRELGIEPNNARKVVIVVDANQVPKVYAEMVGDAGTVAEVVKAADTDIEVIWAARGASTTVGLGEESREMTENG